MLEKIKDYCSKITGRLFLRDISILSNNCISGFLYHKYNLEFKSPTVNLQMKPSDFIKYIKNIDYYNGIELKEVHNPDPAPFIELGGVGEIKFPVGQIDDIVIYFQHYNTFEEAKDKWQTRGRRINKDRMVAVLVDTNCTENEVNDFLRINIPKRFVSFESSWSRLVPNQYFVLMKKSDDKLLWFEKDTSDVFRRRCFETYNWLSFLRKRI